MTSTRLDEAARIAALLESARDTARRLFGADYETRVQPWRDTVVKLAKAWGCRPLQVPPRLEREGALPDNPLLLFAAVVDLTEQIDTRSATP